MPAAEALHRQIEAMKLAFADGMKYVADARYMQTKVQDMLSEAVMSDLLR